MAIKWTDSASKHGITQSEAMFAMANALHVKKGFDGSRVPGGVKPDLYIGPRRLGGELLEVMVISTPPRDLLVFHVMIARPKMLALFEEK